MLTLQRSLNPYQNDTYSRTSSLSYRKIISANWLLFFLFSIVTSFISSLGFLALGFGVLYTMPAAMCMYYAAFRDIVGLPESQTGGTVMHHLVD
ncbi:MAG: hypothetical protein ACI81P_002342 [Neolewinella sp.]|jgi:hypothetical protein